MNPNERHNADVIRGEHWNEPDEAAAPEPLTEDVTVYCQSCGVSMHFNNGDLCGTCRPNFEDDAPPCQFCGETIQDFAKVGRYGCANCCGGEYAEALHESKEIAERAADLLKPDGKAARTLAFIEGDYAKVIEAVPKLLVQRVIVDKSNADYVTIRATIKQTSFGVGSGATLFERAIGDGGELFVVDQTAAEQLRDAEYWKAAYDDAERMNRKIYGALKAIVGEGAALAISQGSEFEHDAGNVRIEIGGTPVAGWDCGDLRIVREDKPKHDYTDAPSAANCLRALLDIAPGHYARLAVVERGKIKKGARESSK